MKRLRFHIVNLAKHGIAPFEAEEAFFDGYKKRRRSGGNYEILGRTNDGRYLQLVYEETETEFRIFHGRDMTQIEKRRYQKK